MPRSRAQKFRDEMDAWVLSLARWLGFIGAGYELFVDHLKNIGSLTVFASMIILPDAWELHRVIRKGPKEEKDK